MINLDILCKALSEVTDCPASRWRKVVRNALAAAGRDISDTRLLESVPPDEADKLLADLRADAPAIERWLMDGLLKSLRSSLTEQYRLRSYLDNLQN